MKKFELKDKKVLAHMGFFNRSCRDRYRENSKEVCAAASTKEYVDIIEIDVRKSSDGILYCYHGNLLVYHFILKFPHTLRQLRRKYHVDTLKEILDVISESKTIFLDVKDRKITKQDLLEEFRGRNFNEVILGNKSVSYLNCFSGMPNQFVKIMNGNILCNFYDLSSLAKKGYKYFEVVLPFQISKKRINDVKANGMEFRCSGLMFLSRGHYWRTIEKYGIKHISSDFIH